MSEYITYLNTTKKYFKAIQSFYRGLLLFFDNRVQILLYDTITTFIGTQFGLNVVLRNEMSLLTNNFVMKQAFIFSCISFGFFLIFRTYKGVWRYFSLRQAFVIISSTSISCLFFAPLILKANTQSVELPWIIIFVNWIMINAIMIGSRFSMRSLYEYWFWDKNTVSSSIVEKVLLVGSGYDTHQIINHIKEYNLKDSGKAYDIVGVIECDSSLVGSKINGTPIVGEIKNIFNIINDLSQNDVHITSVVFANKSLFGKKLQQILESLSDFSVKFKYTDTQFNIKDISIGDLFYNHDPILDTNSLQDIHVCIYGGTSTIIDNFIKILAESKCTNISIWNRSFGELAKVNNLSCDGNIKIISQPIYDKDNIVSFLQNKKIDIFINLSFFSAIGIEHLDPTSCIDVALNENKLLMDVAHRSNIDHYFFVVCDTPYRNTSNMLLPVIEYSMHNYEPYSSKNHLIKLPYIATNNDVYFHNLFSNALSEIHVPQGTVNVSSEEYAIYMLLSHITSIIAKQLWIINEGQFVHELKYSELAKIYQLFYHSDATINIVESSIVARENILNNDICSSIITNADNFKYHEALSLLGS